MKYLKDQLTSFKMHSENVLNDLRLKYNTICNTPSDINQHIPTFYEYTLTCDSVVECGVRNVVSSWGFLMGLVNGRDTTDTPRHLTCCDLFRSQQVGLLESVANNAGIDFEFVVGNDLKLDLPEADIYFIDTWHVYAHLKRELEVFKTKAKRYIMMHDTTVDAIYGESLRDGLDIKKQVEESGYPEGEIRKGLKFAIEEFLAENDDWAIEKVFTNNNGLTILKRL